MRWPLILTLAAEAAVTSACTLPTTPISNTITAQFRIQVQNITRPDVHNKYMNLLPAGGGDQHLFIGPVGDPTFDLTLNQGAIEKGGAAGLHAVIGGEFSEIDYTTKMFTTERGDPRAIFEPTYACNPDTDAVQIELRFITMQNNPAGGWICVRPTFDGAHEFRYYPPGNDRVDPNRECIKVTLVVIPSGAQPSTTVTSSTSTSTSTSSTSTSSSTTTSSSSSSTTFTTSTLTTTSSSTSTSTPSALPFTDLTASGWAFLGCAPEERRAPTTPAGRTLPSALFASDTLTNAACVAFCKSQNYQYAGTEWRRECWCANAVATGRTPDTTIASLANCNYPCSGNSAEYCGGDAWLSLYKECTPGAACVNAVFT